jgi:hypothetical protein
LQGSRVSSTFLQQFLLLLPLLPQLVSGLLLAPTVAKIAIGIFAHCSNLFRPYARQLVLNDGRDEFQELALD